MSQNINIFMSGVTGYIGGTVLARLLKHPRFSSFNITALVRNQEKAAKLNKFGINAIVGSFSDLDLIEDLTSKSDVVISVADSDDFPAAQAVLKGLKKRHQATGVAPDLIHTSGTGVLIDTAAGRYPTDIIYHDDDPDHIETLAPTQPHREVDLEVVRADKDGYVKAYLVIPGTVYGIATGKLVDLGIQKPHSSQIPGLIHASVDRGRAGMVGEGKNLWPNVDIEEVADLYIILFDSILADPAGTPHGREGIYFGESGEHKLYDIGMAIGEALVSLGKAKDAEPTTFTQAELDKYFGGSAYLGTNSRARANRSRALGWKPKKSTADMLASIHPEIVAILSKDR